MAKIKLTKTVVDKAKVEGKGKSYLWDTDLDGFGVKVRKTSTTFVVRYSAPGSKGKKRREYTIGPFGPYTVQQARVEAMGVKAQIARGIDPLDKRDEAPALTVSALSDIYLERHARPRKATAHEDERRFAQHVLPSIGELVAETVTRGQVSELHHALRDRPYEANMVLALVRVMYTKAEQWGLVPIGHPNPASGIDKYEERERERFLTPEEMPRVAAAIAAEGDEHLRALIWLYLLTGCRRGELLEARWDQVDLERGTLSLSRTKQKRPHIVRLGGLACELLEKLPRVEGNPHLFPGRKPGSHRVNVNKAWGRIRQAAGVGDVRIHDLRRTLASWMAIGGDSLVVIGRALGHSQPTTTAIYARLTDDPVARAVDEAGDALAAAAGLVSPEDESGDI